MVAVPASDQHAECFASWREAMRDPDPQRGFQETILQLCATQVVDRGYTTAMLSGRGLDAERSEYDRALLVCCSIGRKRQGRCGRGSGREI
jgi:hypothetical protein